MTVFTIGHINSVCLNNPTTTESSQFGNMVADKATNPLVVTSTINMNEICLFNTGVRLNATAVSQLALISSNVIDQTSCCALCNHDIQCDYAFETLTKCDLYHWNIPEEISPFQLAVQVKSGQWYEKKFYAPNSGKVLFSNRFVQLILQMSSNGDY